MRKFGRFFALFLLAFAAASPALASGDGALGAQLGLWMGIPFVGMLLSIALFPLLAPGFWHHHFGKVTAFWGLSLAAPFVFMHHGQAVYEIAHVYVADYLPFLILIWALYTVAGGILVSGSLSGTPLANSVMLLLGTLAASLVGTTGAAMLLIRPFLRANECRNRRTHQAVFFIFLVCNVGGALTPLGDPPLFLGFLHGVPFFWTLNLFAPMAAVSSFLLLIFFLLDSYHYRREPARPKDLCAETLRVEGAHNLLFLLGIVGAVLASGLLSLGDLNLFGIHRPVADLLRDAALILLGVFSLRTTPKVVRERNQFSWAPIREVAILFAGIFVTMIPVVLMLKAGADGAFAFLIEAVRTPAHYFWAAGILSSFLDNAPTYLVFFNTALGNFSPGLPEAQALPLLIAQNGVYLKAIACGAVFMGANSYIGNAPNFMILSIAQENGVEMPSFFGYILKYSLVFLIPAFLAATFLFF